MPVGRLKKFVPDKGFGFISPDDGSSVDNWATSWPALSTSNFSGVEKENTRLCSNLRPKSDGL